MELNPILEKNVGRWFATGSWTHQGMILEVSKRPSNRVRLLFIEFIGPVFGQNPKLDTYDTTLKNYRLNDYKPEREEKRKAMKFIFENVNWISR
jgi:hypothetical protein